MFEFVYQLVDWIGALIIALILAIIYAFGATAPTHTTPLVHTNPPVPAPKDEVLGGGKKTHEKQKYRILSFNVEYEAASYSPAEVMQIIDSLGADVVVLNEAHEKEGPHSTVIPHSTVSPHSTVIPHSTVHSSKIADAFIDYNYVYSHDWAIIASRYSITQPYLGKTANKYLETAALIDDKFYILSAHLTDYPYQPFQLAHIPYCYETCQKNICSRPYEQGADTVSTCTKKSAESQMIEQAHLARGADVDMIISAIEELRGKPVLLAGDFNEPSHLDWSEEAVRAGEQPLRVRFPTSSRLAAAGMQDLFRAVHPDPVKNPGHTWPARPLTKEYLADLSLGQIKEQISTPTDRIDFIYGKGFTPLSADVIATPSDHNAVTAEVE